MSTVVYVDVLLFINTIITYAVLITAVKLFKRETTTLRLMLASFTGSLFSLLIFMDMQGFLFALLIKAVSSLLIALIAFPFINRKEYLKITLATVGVSVVYSGVFVLIYQLFKPPNMLIINDIVYFEFNPLILLGCTAIIYILITLFDKLFRERIKSSVVPLSFTVDEVGYSCTGKVDTGCNLKEPFSGAPVIIVDNQLFVIKEVMQRRVIPYSAVGSTSILYAVKAEQVRIDGTFIEKAVYIASAPLKNEHFQAIINSEILR